MDLKTRSFVYNVAVDCRLRHTHRRLGKRIIGFAVQLEVRHPHHSGWVAIVRYDTAHGFAHRDRRRPDGSYEKTPLPIEDYSQALHYAEADLKDQWEFYRDRFLEDVQHEKR